MSDVLVIGAGIFGLWCARACLAAGCSVTLAERAQPGAGASGGPVGALAPHDPSDWTPLKALQLAGLAALPAEIAALEAETGLATGYARTGRLRPLTTAAAQERVPAQAAAAAGRWQGLGELRLLDAPPAGTEALLAPGAAPFGWVQDTLTARIDPPACLAALEAALAGRVRRLDGWRLLRIEGHDAVFDHGRVSAGHIVLAAGWESLALAGLAGGSAVKGQAALIVVRLLDDAPVLTAPGLYVVAHGPGRVAIGSTAEPEWEHDRPDARLEPVIARARALCPPLAEARVVQRWAGLRPRAPGPGPVIGPLPGRPHVLVATGGYKIGFALAHLAGRAVAAAVVGQPAPALPSVTPPAALAAPS